MESQQRIGRTLRLGIGTVAALLVALPAVRGDNGHEVGEKFRGCLGKGSAKIKTEDGKTYVWAGGDRSGPGSEWYDFTGSPIAPEDLQFGIGKDRIRSIDDGLYVAPDDPRLLQVPASRYRPDEKPKTTDDIMVLGVVEGGEARAFPTALLDRHELVNDQIGGKPVTVGW